MKLTLNTGFIGTLCTMMALILVLTCSTTVLAQNNNKPESSISVTENEPIATIKYVSTNNILAYASVSRRTISADISITAMNINTPNDGTISIQKSEKGSWKTVTKWRFSGKGPQKISKKYSGKCGSYRIYVSGKVGSDRITCYSSTVTIK